VPDDVVQEPAVSAGLPDQREAIAGWYLRRSHRRLWMLPLTAWLLVFIAVLLLRGTVEDPRANFRASQAAFLALAPPSLPKGENAAEDYALAQTAFVPFAPAQGKSNSDLFSNITGDSKFFETQEVQTFLANNTLALQHLYAGAAKAKCNWGLNYDLRAKWGNPTRFPWGNNNENLLAAHARASAHAGDHKAAAKSIATIYRLAEQCCSDPVFERCWGAVATARLADRTVEAISTWDTPGSLDDLDAYRKAVWHPRWGSDVVLGFLAAWKKQGLGYMDGVACGALQAGIFHSLPAQHLTPRGGGILGYGPERHCVAAVMDEIIARSARGQYLNTKDMEELVAKHQTGPARLAAEIISYVQRHLERYANSEEQARVADAGLAFLMFRMKHGRDPKSLDELVPEFMPAVPQGIRCPQPLRMKMEPEGVFVKDVKNSPPVRRYPGATRIFAARSDGVDEGGYSSSDGFSLYDDKYNASFCVPPREKPAPESGGKAP